MLNIVHTGYAQRLVLISGICIGVLTLTSDECGQRAYEAAADGLTFGIYGRECEAVDALKCYASPF